MNRLSALGRLVFSVAMLIGSLTVGRLALPENVFACYCAPAPMATYVDDPAVVVVVGTVVAPDAVQGFVEHGTFVISRIFKGLSLTAQMPIRGGSDGECLLPLQAGREMLIVAKIDKGTLVPSTCWPNATLQSEAGQILYADAVAAFGPGHATALTDATSEDVLWLGSIVLAALAAAAGILAVLVILVRRRRSA